MAASATPTTYDPKRLWTPLLLATVNQTAYTAAPGERGTKLSQIVLANGGPQAFAKVWQRDISVGYIDQTAAASSLAAADVALFNTDSVAQADEFYVGNATKFSHILCLLSTLQVGGTTLDIAYGTTAGNPGTYTSLTAAANNLIDGTSLLRQSGEISFTPPVGTPWVTTTPGAAAAGYFIRLKFTAGPITTAPVGTQVLVGSRGAPLVTIYAVPKAGSAGLGNPLAYGLPLPSNSGISSIFPSGGPAVDVIGSDGLIMSESDFLVALCSVENQVVMHGSGIEMAA